MTTTPDDTPRRRPERPCGRAPIVTFRDALGFAMELADEYAFVSAAALLDRTGALLDLAIVEGIGQSIDPVVDWAIGIDPATGRQQPDRSMGPAPPRPGNHGRATGRAPDGALGRIAHQPIGAGAWSGWPVAVILVSVRPYDVGVIREDDLVRYRRARWAISGAGAHLSDWIETDGDLFRSYAYLTCPAEAWPHDPPTERRSDRPW